MNIKAKKNYPANRKVPYGLRRASINQLITHVLTFAFLVLFDMFEFEGISIFAKAHHTISLVLGPYGMFTIFIIALASSLCVQVFLLIRSFDLVYFIMACIIVFNMTIPSLLVFTQDSYFINPMYYGFTAYLVFVLANIICFFIVLIVDVIIDKFRCRK